MIVPPMSGLVVEACQKFGMTFAGQTEEEDVLRLHVLQTRTGKEVFDSSRQAVCVHVK